MALRATMGPGWIGLWSSHTVPMVAVAKVVERWDFPHFPRRYRHFRGIL
jgi:hypothetical protein